MAGYSLLIPGLEEKRANSFVSLEKALNRFYAADTWWVRAVLWWASKNKDLQIKRNLISINETYIATTHNFKDFNTLPVE